MQKPFYVYIGNTLVDKVTYDDDMTAEEVKKSLVNHDGYDPRIEVEAQERKSHKTNTEV